MGESFVPTSEPIHTTQVLPSLQISHPFKPPNIVPTVRVAGTAYPVRQTKMQKYPFLNPLTPAIGL